MKPTTQANGLTPIAAAALEAARREEEEWGFPPSATDPATGRALPMTVEERAEYQARAIAGLDAIAEMGTPEEQRESLLALARGLDAAREPGFEVFGSEYIKALEETP
jgi:hypothetical protein